jgi:hypothetical protein
MDMQPDPFDVPMIFLRVGWMDHYRGITGGDTISSGGAYVAEHGFGHEIFNFQPFQNAVYGYAQPTGRKDKWSEAKINLKQLGASKDDKSVSGVLAIWVATSPTGGAFVIGWYKNATIFRECQSPPAGSVRRYKDTDCGYYVTARAEDAFLLPPDARLFSVPQQKKGGFGQSNIWYANDREQHRQFRLDVLGYVETGKVSTVPLHKSPYAPRQPDPLLRQRVERIAIEITTKHFADLGYNVDSVEKDNVGWDLSAILGRRELKLEVKGLSGPQIIVDLTPNEYAAMQKHRDSYRVCVVTDALTDPCLAIFAYSPDSEQWEGPAQRRLDIQEIIAARCSAIRV